MTPYCRWRVRSQPESRPRPSANRKSSMASRRPAPGPPGRRGRCAGSRGGRGGGCCQSWGLLTGWGSCGQISCRVKYLRTRRAGVCGSARCRGERADAEAAGLGEEQALGAHAGLVLAASAESAAGFVGVGDVAAGPSNPARSLVNLRLLSARTALTAVSLATPKTPGDRTTARCWTSIPVSSHGRPVRDSVAPDSTAR